MLFAIRCTDGPEGGSLRPAHREAHLAHIARHMDQVVLAGPLQDDDGRPIGSLLVLDLPDRASAEAFVAEDPYAKAGVFATVSVEGFKQVFPRPA